MPLTILPLFIQAGQSLGDPVDCSAGPIVKLTLPGNFVGDTISFATSSDGILYNDAFDEHGHEIVYTVIAGTGILGMRLTTGFVKIRSGTRERPVVQPELREFAVALDVVTPPASTGELRVRLLGGFAP